MATRPPASFQEIAGQALDPSRRAALAVDGVEPEYYVEPESPAEVAEVLRAAADAGLAVIPRGQGTKLALGNPPRAGQVALSLARLNRILEYTPEDLTMTVQAGARLMEVQAELARHGQQLALDPPFFERGTIGGTLATNASGPRRLKYGTARDLVIGIRVAQVDGAITHAGGKVVKNVAGYDLMKLYVGSLGTLAVIVEATFKLHPLPPAERSVAAVFSSFADAQNAALRLLRSPFLPAALEVLTPAMFATLERPSEWAGLETQGACVVLAWSAGVEALVRRQSNEIEKLLREAGAGALVSTAPADGQVSRTLWQSLLRRRSEDWERVDGLFLKAAVLPNRVAVFCERAGSVLAEHGLSWRLSGELASGVLYVRIDGAEGQAQTDVLAQVIRQLRAAAQEDEGSLVVLSCPVEVKRLVDVWGEPAGPLSLMRRLKQEFDPQGILNPGRFIGGL
jgi:glycolate oxidase FAD binding subunit